MTYTPAEANILAQMASMSPPLALPTYHGIEPPMGKPRNATEEIANARAEIERETK